MRRETVDRIRSGVSGTVRIAESLTRHTSLKIGGPAALWVEPKDTQDLKKILAIARSSATPFFIIGGGSNLLVKDSGFDGIIIHLGAPFFKNIGSKGSAVRVGAGFPTPKLVQYCCDHSLSGIESLIGIPGTIGGAVYMNAGGWANPIFRNIGEFIESVKVMSRAGVVTTLRRADLMFRYRASNLDGCIILEVTLELTKAKDDTAFLRARCARFLAMKKQKQVLDQPSAGCIFKNPENSQFTCGQMIDMLGLKGLRRGGAEVSAKHANFIVNRANARCSDVMALIKFIRTRVLKNYKVPLELEVKII